MLVIRMQRTGRKGHAQFRVVVQDSRRTPTSGKVVAQLGHYNPHTKQAVIDIEKATTFVGNGAQPTSRVALLLKNEGVKLPRWVKINTTKKREVKDAEKRRSTRPAEEVAEEAQTEAADVTSAPEPEVSDVPTKEVEISAEAIKPTE